MSDTLTTQRAYPWTTTIKGKAITLRPMQRADLDKALLFAKALPEDDLLFLTFDITDRAQMEQWVQAIENKKALTILAETDGRFVGYSSLSYNQLNWTRHLGEIRLQVSPEMRGMGLGKLLVNEIFSLAQELGLQKLVAQMAAEQQSAVQVFEHLGFKAEALLTDHVIDRKGQTHDLIVMSYDVTGFTEQ
jgi:L-amino acid N-acyltransferase YncA